MGESCVIQELCRNCKVRLRLKDFGETKSDPHVPHSGTKRLPSRSERNSQFFFASEEKESFFMEKEAVHAAHVAEQNSYTEVKPRKKVLAYDIAFDTQAYRALAQLQTKNPALYQQEKERLHNYTEMQLVTNLGERFNVALSTVQYDIHDGLLFGKDMTEPFITIIQRGRDYRRIHGNPVDWAREDAEVVGFTKTQQVLSKPETPVGTIMLSIFPPGQEGTSYTHNFYDMYVLKERASGRRYVETTRYSSGVVPQEYIDKMRMITGKNVFVPGALDAYFLQNPLQFSGGDPEKIHTFLQQDVDALSQEEFAFIVQGTASYRKKYTDILSNNPYDLQLQALAFNAILNKADEVWGKIKNKTIGTASRLPVYADEDEVSNDQIRYWGSQPVRAVASGCGDSIGAEVGGMGGVGGNSDVSATGPYGVAEYGRSRPEDDLNLCRCNYQSPHFHCPGSVEVPGTEQTEPCRNSIIVGRGIKKCIRCGEGQRC